MLEGLRVNAAKYLHARTHSWQRTRLHTPLEPTDRCTDTPEREPPHTHTHIHLQHDAGSACGGISLGQWERDESGAITQTIPGGERKDENWRDRTEAWRGKDEKNNTPHPHPSITQLVLTFRLHQLLHNILLALVKRELAWEVEAFFALYFDWLFVWVRRGEGAMRGWQQKKQNGIQWRYSTGMQKIKNKETTKKK